MTEEQTLPTECDVVVVGAGAGGLTAAITMAKAGLKPIVIEKANLLGGSTAFSGGVLWIPGSHLARQANIKDSRDAARTYLRHETGTYYDDEAVEALLENGPRMLEFFEQETEVHFALSMYPDYHPDAPGGVEVGRSVTAVPFDATKLGKHLRLLRPPRATMTFIGMMFNSSNPDLKHFFNATRSLRSAWYVAKRLVRHGAELVRYGRGIQITSGNALAARLIKSALDLSIPLVPCTEAVSLVHSNGRVSGVRVRQSGNEQTLQVRKAVVLGCGGFPHDARRVRQAYPHAARGHEHLSAASASDTGDGIALGESAGGVFQPRFASAAAWMPMSKVPGKGGEFDVFPHLVDRYKPGVIAVNISGRRFTNESASYHDVGVAIAKQPDAQAWLVCDRRTFGKYGLGFAKPPPIPTRSFTSTGYLKKANTIEDLAALLHLPEANFRQTVDEYNRDARTGTDTKFGRGSTAFNRFLGDPDNKPNPNVAPILTPPFYAVKLHMGDIGTLDGLLTDVHGRVLNRQGIPIRGLYAVGSDRASMMGGNYPGAGITLGPIMTFAYMTGQHICTRERESQETHMPVEAT